MRAVPFLLFLIACGDSTPPPAAPEAQTAPKSTASTSAAPLAESPAKKLDALTAGEAKSGTCDAGHQAALEKYLSDVESAVKNEGFDLVSKRTIALSENSRGVEMSVTGKGTEVHVMAFSPKDVSMDVLAGTAAATTMRSPLAKDGSIEIPNVGPTPLMRDSRQIAIKPGQPLQVKLTGQGCAGLISVVKR